MSKHRSLDDDFWKDPKLRKEPMHLRMLLAGLITEAADDEGRFEVEPYGWLDAYFARHDPITEDDIRAAWDRLCELGICVEYDGGQHGFLTAWFRRQLVQNPRPSTLPTPDPMDGVVTSRAMMSAVYDLYLKQAGGKGKSWMTVAAHWWASLEAEDRLKLAGGSLQEVTVNEPLAEVTYSKLLFRLGRDVTGRERTKGNDSSPRPADAPSLELILEPDPPKPPARSKLDPAQVQADIDAARATFPQDLLSGIDAFLDACRAENKTGAIALTRERTETQSLAAAYAKLGDGPFRYGLDAALRKGAANVNYLKTAAGSYSADAPRRPQANAYDDPQEAARREYAEQHDRLFGGVR
jgi:hypothetical protein